MSTHGLTQNTSNSSFSSDSNGNMTLLEKDAAIADREKDLEWHRNMLERYREAIRSKNFKIKSLETELGKVQPSRKLKSGEALAAAAAAAAMEDDEDLLFRKAPGGSAHRRSYEYETTLLLDRHHRNSSLVQAEEPQDLIRCQEELAKSKQMCQSREQEIVGFQRIIVALQNENTTYRKKEHGHLVKQASLNRENVFLNEKLRIQPFDEKRMFESEQKIAMQNSIIQKLEADIHSLQQDDKAQHDTMKQLHAQIIQLESSLLEVRGEKDSIVHMLEQSRAVAARAFQELDDYKAKQSTLQEQLVQKEKEKENLNISLQECQSHISSLQEQLHVSKQKDKEIGDLNSSLQAGIARLELEVQTLTENTKALASVHNNAIQLSSEESTALKDDLIMLRKENDILSMDNTYLKDKLANLSKENEENARAQAEESSLQEQLHILEQKEKENETLKISLDDYKAKQSTLQEQLHVLAQKDKGNETLNISLQQENETLNISLQACQSQISRLELEVQTLTENTKALASVHNNVIQLSSEESTALEDDLINLRKENNLLSVDNTYLKNELANLSKQNEEIRLVQAEESSLQEQLHVLEQKEKENETLNISLVKDIETLKISLDDYKAKQSTLQEQLHVLAQKDKGNETLNISLQKENETLNISLQACQSQISRLELEVQTLTENALASVHNSVIQLSSEESTALEDVLHILRKENNLLSVDNTQLRNELTKLSKGNEEIVLVQDEVKSLQDRILGSQLQCQEHERALYASQARIQELECEVSDLKASIVETSYASLLDQSQAAKEMNLMDEYLVLDMAISSDRDDKVPETPVSRNDPISNSKAGETIVNKSLFDAYYDDDNDSRYGPLDEKDDVFFLHYTEIISGLKMKLESKDNQIQIIKSTLKDKDETIADLKKSLIQIQANRMTAEALAQMEIEEQSLALNKKKEKKSPSKKLDDKSKEVTVRKIGQSRTSDDSMNVLKNTMLEGFSSFKDMALLVVSPFDPFDDESVPGSKKNEKEESASNTLQKSSSRSP